MARGIEGDCESGEQTQSDMSICASPFRAGLLTFAFAFRLLLLLLCLILYLTWRVFVCLPISLDLGGVSHFDVSCRTCRGKRLNLLSRSQLS